MPYTPILGTLGYIVNRATHEVLLVHRNKRSNDEHLGKWNGLGGKLETNEDLASGMRREIHEDRKSVV